MRTVTSRTLVATVSAAVLLSAVIGSGEAAAAPAKGTSAALRALVGKTNALPRSAASRAQRARLRRAARRARAVARRRPCSAVASLGSFRRVLRGVKPKSGRRFRRSNQQLARLAPDSLKASFLLLRDNRTRRCGGDVRRNGIKSTSTRVLQSDINGMRLRVRLPDLRYVPQTGGGRTWTQLMLPNTDSPGRPGTPGIPVSSSQFAIPDGASVSIDAKASDKYTVDGVDVYPIQPEPVDADSPAPDFSKGRFADRPFELSDSAYARNAPVPSQPADADSLGKLRDVSIGTLQIPAAQYNPAAKRLTVFTSIDVTVAFNGGSKSFPNEINSPWERPFRRLLDSLINRRLFEKPWVSVFRRCGEEMLVLTNPATIDAANSFAALKRAQGMRTSVFQTGAAPVGSTATELQTFIRSRLTAILCIRPSYVTIMGDDDLVATGPGINGIPSDHMYSLRDGGDELPDVAVGRILGNDQAAVQTAVNKISTYETTPPTGPMLRRATIAAQFQDDNNDGRENRTFIQFAETVRTGLVGRGVAVDRIYDDSPDATPTQFNDGTALPAELQKPTFAWDGDGADVSAAWNEGRFMVIHRDHGWSDGWGHPGFSTTNVQALTNGANLPVVLSINCSSGAFDYDETSFASESLVKADGGSVGVFGDTRDSPSWHNTQIAWGFVDAMLPSVLPSEGPAEKQRVGAALMHGKMRLAGLAPPATDGSTRNELYLWHYFGDPSMQMWGGDGLKIVNPALFAAQYVALAVGTDGPPYEVNVTLPPEFNGEAFSLLRNGEVVGKGTAANGVAKIPAEFGDGSVKPGELVVVLEADGAPAIKIPVSGIPSPTSPPPPPAEKEQTTLTMTCPAEGGSNDPLTVSGRLVDVPAGSIVDVTFDYPGNNRGAQPRTETVKAATDAQGNWTATIQPNSFEGNVNWTITSRYAGDADHAASGPRQCMVFVRDQS